MKVVSTPVKQIHQETLRECPEETVMLLLEVAHDLRNGIIKEEEFDMRYFTGHAVCRTTHCVAGWVAVKAAVKDERCVVWKRDRLGIKLANYYLMPVNELFTQRQIALFYAQCSIMGEDYDISRITMALCIKGIAWNRFKVLTKASVLVKSSEIAAEAIEEYVFNYARYPWDVVLKRYGI